MAYGNHELHVFLSLEIDSWEEMVGMKLNILSITKMSAKSHMNFYSYILKKKKSYMVGVIF